MFDSLKCRGSRRPRGVFVRVRIVDLLPISGESSATAAFILRPQVGVVRQGGYTEISASLVQEFNYYHLGVINWVKGHI